MKKIVLILACAFVFGVVATLAQSLTVHDLPFLARQRSATKVVTPYLTDSFVRNGDGTIVQNGDGTQITR